MMKKFLYLTLCVALLAACNKDEVEKNVAQDFDTSFAQLLQERGYITDANHFTAAEVADIDYLDVSGTPEDYTAGKGLTSLQGIEWFTSLRILFCDYNQLTNLDVSNNTELTDLDCSSNQLTNLDVSNNTELTSLSCSSNQLTNLDVSNNMELISLSCDDNPGDQESTFPVTAWFSENNIPEELDYAKTWYYNEKEISVVFRKSK